MPEFHGVRRSRRFRDDYLDIKWRHVVGSTIVANAQLPHGGGMHEHDRMSCDRQPRYRRDRVPVGRLVLPDHRCLTSIIFADAVNYRQNIWIATETMWNVDIKTLYVTLYIAQFLTLQTLRLLGR